MSLHRKKYQKRQRRTLRVRSKMNNASRARVSVFRSVKHIYAQIIDDVQHHTLIACSTLELNPKGDKKVRARTIGLELAKRAIEKGIKDIQFDRGPFLYHGRVKELAEGLREGGLQF